MDVGVRATQDAKAGFISINEHFLEAGFHASYALVQRRGRTKLEC